MAKTGPFTYEKLAETIDTQSWEVGSEGYGLADPVSVFRYCQTWVERTPDRHPLMEQGSYQGLAPNYRAWLVQRRANQLAPLWRGRPTVLTSGSNRV